MLNSHWTFALAALNMHFFCLHLRTFFVEVIAFFLNEFSSTQFSFFGSILTVGSMIGAITSGNIADFLGRKRVRKLHVGLNYASLNEVIRKNFF